MKYRKFNRYEKKENKANNVREAMSGGGVYLYQNSNANAELTLPRPTKSGVRLIKPNGQFQGDDYYMQLVRTGMLRLVEVLQTAEQETQAVLDQSEENTGDQTMNESNQLILDQPNIVTSAGQVEHIVRVDGTTERKMNEELKVENQEPVLLNEGPMDDGFIIVQ